MLLEVVALQASGRKKSTTSWRSGMRRWCCSLWPLQMGHIDHPLSCYLWFFRMGLSMVRLFTVSSGSKVIKQHERQGNILDFLLPATARWLNFQKKALIWKMDVNGALMSIRRILLFTKAQFPKSSWFIFPWVKWLKLPSNNLLWSRFQVQRAP